MVVDEMHEEHPELLRDQYWEQVVPQDLPYNLASEHFRRQEPQGSTASLKVKASESVYADLPVRHHPEDVYADYVSPPYHIQYSNNNSSYELCQLMSLYNIVYTGKRNGLTSPRFPKELDPTPMVSSGKSPFHHILSPQSNVRTTPPSPPPPPPSFTLRTNPQRKEIFQRHPKL